MESEAVKGSCSELQRPQANIVIRQNPELLLSIELFEDCQGFFWIRHADNEQSFLR